jgi:hypothetical protein
MDDLSIVQLGDLTIGHLTGEAVAIVVATCILILF